MQNDIIKPPASNPLEPQQQAEPTMSPPTQKTLGGEVHAAPSEHQTAQGTEVDVPVPAEEADPLSTTQLSLAQKPKNRRPVGAILTAVVVFLGLAGGAVYITLQNQKDNKPTVATTQAPATTNTAADTSSEIDDALNEAAQLPTSNEDPASDLSDQTLGL